MQQRVHDRFAAQRFRRVRLGSARELCPAAALESKDWLLARHPLGDPGEVLGIAERLHVEHQRDRPLVFLAPLQQIVGRDIDAVTGRDEDRDPQLTRRRVLEQPDPGRGRLRADRKVSGAHRGATERRVESDGVRGVDNPQGIRSDQPHARVADDLQQSLFPVGRTALLLTRSNDKRCGPDCRRLRRELAYVLATSSDHHELRDERQLHDATRCLDRTDHAPVAVDRSHNSLEATGDDVRQQSAPNVARRRRRAHDSHRRGRQDRLQRGDRREMVALVDPLDHRLARRDIERDGELAQRPLTPHGETDTLEHPKHRPVLHITSASKR